MQFLDAPAVIVRSEGSSLWARNSCSSRINATGLSTDQCLNTIYDGGDGAPSSQAVGPWWHPGSAPEAPDSAVQVRYANDLGVVGAAGVVVMLAVSGKRARRVCRRQARTRRLCWALAGSNDLKAPLGMA